MSSGKWRPFCLGLNVLIPAEILVHLYMEAIYLWYKTFTLYYYNLHVQNLHVVLL